MIHEIVYSSDLEIQDGHLRIDRVLSSMEVLVTVKFKIDWCITFEKKKPIALSMSRIKIWDKFVHI